MIRSMLGWNPLFHGEVHVRSNRLRTNMMLAQRSVALSPQVRFSMHEHSVYFFHPQRNVDACHVHEARILYLSLKPQPVSISRRACSPRQAGCQWEEFTVEEHMRFFGRLYNLQTVLRGKSFGRDDFDTEARLRLEVRVGT